MKVFRLSREKYAHTLSGYGAALHGQRWNSKGTEVVYTAESRALAFSEVAVHISLALLPADYRMVEIDIPNSVSIREIPLKTLPQGWDAIPARPVTQNIGDEFVADNKFAVLRVPSVVVKGDFNYIINPSHRDFKKIKITGSSSFPFDPRLVRTMA
ncbi:MAG: RES family NAD+ phosphorylase [Cryomorphaceae bacterium]